MVQKFVMGSPLYRQKNEFKRQGIPLKRQTMSNWLVWTSEHLLTPVVPPDGAGEAKGKT